ncbi:MAG: V-type ATP synthase subunit E [Oscillospiraceae bacterium]|jgi:V/A-type H+-transporting ATPase subunit E|nr:V-type ATP synthase subunit E [Oscillospiraceae bacterium]
MNGIDKITARVIAEAEAEAEALQAEANKIAGEIIRDADARAQELTDRIVDRGRGEAGRLGELAVSSAETDARKAMLSMKQDLVSEAFGLALKKLRSLDDDKYISLLASLAAGAKETGTEEIILNESDRERFGEAVAAEANRLCSGSLTLSRQTRPIVGGLILSQGNIEVNCALDTLLSLRRNELAGAAAGLLFDQGAAGEEKD